MKTILYTALMGDCKDRLRPLPPGMTGFAFLDYEQFWRHEREGLDRSGWVVMPVDFDNPYSVWAVRRIKMYPESWLPMLEEEDVSIWMDASFEITGSLDWLLEGKAESMACLRHPFHKNAIEEAQALGQTGQLDKYIKEGFPADTYLQPIGGILARRCCEETRLFEKIWAEEYAAGCDRDQISLGYAIWKSNILIAVSDINYAKDRKSGFRFHKA